MSDEKQIAAVVSRVLGLLLPQLGADGRHGALISVFTGATVDVDQAISQIRSLILKGYVARLVFSEMAEHLYGEHVREQLAGFPQWDVLPPVTWFAALREAKAVIVPMLSVNSLSKIAQLLADNQTSNIILHGLFSGKPVVLAQDGVENTEGRKKLGFHRGNGNLLRAVEARLRLAVEHGCILTPVIGLADKVAAILRPASAAGHPAQAAVETMDRSSSQIRIQKAVITAGDVMAAQQSGADLRCSAQAVITPLARDAAMKLGVQLIRDGEAVFHQRGGAGC
jgi:hypothetical protein